MQKKGWSKDKYPLLELNVYDSVFCTLKVSQFLYLFLD